MAYHDAAMSFAGKRRRVRKQDSLSEPPRKSPHDDGAFDAASKRPLASRRRHVGSKDISVVSTIGTSEAHVTATDAVPGGLCSKTVPEDTAAGNVTDESSRGHRSTPVFVYSRVTCQTAKRECDDGHKRGCKATIPSSRHYTTDDVCHGQLQVDCFNPYDLTPIMRSLSMECFDGLQESSWRPGSHVVRSDSMPESSPLDDDFGLTSVRNLRRGAICYDDNESVGLMAGLSLYV